MTTKRWKNAFPLKEPYHLSPIVKCRTVYVPFPSYASLLCQFIYGAMSLSGSKKHCLYCLELILPACLSFQAISSSGAFSPLSCFLVSNHKPIDALTLPSLTLFP